MAKKKKKILSVANVVAIVKDLAGDVIAFYKSLPEDDKRTYGIMNRKPEIIAGVGEEVVITTAVTAQTLALKSLEKGVLVLDGANDEMIREMESLLGDEIFNELAAKSVQTMELHPQPTIEQQIELAKADYLARREAEKEMLKEMEADQAFGTGESAKDVEQDKTI